MTNDNDYSETQRIAQLDQVEGGTAALARIVATYYNVLVENGVPAVFAVHLATQYQNKIMEGVKKE